MFYKQNKYRLSQYELDRGTVVCPECGDVLSPTIRTQAFACDSCQFTVTASSVGNLPPSWKQPFILQQRREVVAEQLKEAVDMLTKAKQYNAAQRLAHAALDLEPEIPHNANLQEAMQLLAEAEDEATNSDDNRLHPIAARIALAKHQVLN